MRVRLTPKQAEYVREAHHRWNLATGAVRSGKSHLAVQYTIPDRLLKMRSLKGLPLILGATKENIERNVLTPMRDMWGDKFVGDINSRNWCEIFGERVYCIGAENSGQVSKLRGSEIKFCYCDEICDLHPEVFEMLKSRLSLEYSECHGACNPAGPNHWLKRFIDKGTADGSGIDMFCQRYTIYDNPFLPDEYVKGLEAEYRGTVYFDRYILGLWAKAEGLVYPNWQEALEDPYDKGKYGYCISVDYGTQNPLHAIKFVKDGGGIWHAVDEFRYSGREEGRQKTDTDYVNDLVDFTYDAPEDDAVEIIVDPSASSFIAALRRRGGFKVRKADNDVLNGIRDTASAMQLGQLRIGDNLKKLKEEFAGYVWDDRDDVDKPVKVDDHGMDALRYFVRTKRVYKPRRQYKSPFQHEDAAGPRRFTL